MIKFIALLFAIVYSASNVDYNNLIHSANFDCFQEYNGQTPTGTTCCGIVANGERHCGDITEWNEYQGSYRRCSNSLATAQSQGMDLCCESSEIENCGVCKSFFVWEFESYEDFENSDKVTTDNLDWRTDYLDQDLSDQDAYDNNIYPGGFAHGTLKEFNEPPLCVFIPGAAGRVIEIKVEPDEQGDRLCVGDLQDDINGRNDPGQITTCDDVRLNTCFPDGSINPTKDGFPFYIFCDESCEEGGDVMLWFRARYSEQAWTGDNNDVLNNVEMWCEYVLRDYPEYDVYPSDITPPADPNLGDGGDSAAALVLFFVFTSLVLLF